jgi:hypothetical protein
MNQEEVDCLLLLLPIRELALEQVLARLRWLKHCALLTLVHHYLALLVGNKKAYGILNLYVTKTKTGVNYA